MGLFDDVKFGEDEYTKYLPPREYVPKKILLEPVTHDRYTRTEVGYYRIPEVDRMIHAPDFTPPATWDLYDPGKLRLTRFFHDTFGPEYLGQKASRAGEPVPIRAVLIMAKSISRSYLDGKVGMHGVYMWINFHRIDPCWFIMGARSSHWLRSEEEWGYKHG